jgi:hypothetical protein
LIRRVLSTPRLRNLSEKRHLIRQVARGQLISLRAPRDLRASQL